jgi:hypothetical protein
MKLLAHCKQQSLVRMLRIGVLTSPNFTKWRQELGTIVLVTQTLQNRNPCIRFCSKRCGEFTKVADHFHKTDFPERERSFNENSTTQETASLPTETSPTETEVLINPLRKIFTACLAFGYIPKPCRKVKVIFIPKPGRDTYEMAKAFRPISLTSFFFRTM